MLWIEIEPGFFSSCETQIPHLVLTRTKKGRRKHIQFKIVAQQFDRMEKTIRKTTGDGSVLFTPVLKETPRQPTAPSLCGTPHWDCNQARDYRQCWSPRVCHFPNIVPVGKGRKKAFWKAGKQQKRKKCLIAVIGNVSVFSLHYWLVVACDTYKTFS